MNAVKTRYPIYIVSKGRWESRLTAKALDRMKLDYYIVVEPQEYDNYSNVINKDKILILPFGNLGQGSIPARNWIMDDSIKKGFQRHWILDDNIGSFSRLHNNRKIKVIAGTIFKCIEDFVDRYENIHIAGMDYRQFASEREKMAPFVLNTRVYSCILLKNDSSFRWRGKYNEDTDLCIRILKAGFCSVLFKAFLCDKVGTLKMKGGNTDNVYIDGDKRLNFAKSLNKQHPDIAKIVWRYNRWHHEVNYGKFKKNKLRRKKDLVFNNKINNYGMKLIKVKI